MNTLTVRKAMDLAYSLRQATHRREIASHNAVIRTTAALKAARASARPGIQKTLTYQTTHWRLWVQLYNQRAAAYLNLVSVNAATEADFRAKSARALSTARAVPARAACRAPADPYVGAIRRTVASHPGMSVTNYAKAGRTPVWVTVANLMGPGAKTTVGPVTGQYVADRSLLARQLTGSGAFVGVNADFYNLGPGKDNTPWGPVIKRGGAIVNSATHMGFKSFLVQPNRLATFGTVQVLPVLHHGSYSVPANSLNSHMLPINGIAVFTPAWGPASRTWLRPTGAIREYDVDQRGIIMKIRRGLSTAAIPRGGLMIVAQNAAIDRLRAARFNLGQRVTLTTSATYGASKGVYSAVGVGAQFLQNGQFRISCRADHPVARQAIGITPGGREIVLVTVRGGTDSLTGKYTGVGGATTWDVAALMSSLGVYNAAMFDGGGSTILMAKVGATYRQFQAAPGFIRPVSVSFGIWPG